MCILSEGGRGRFDNTQGRRCEGGSRHRREVATSQGMQQPPGAGGGWNGPSLKPLGGARYGRHLEFSLVMLILDLWPPES